MLYKHTEIPDSFFGWIRIQKTKKCGNPRLYIPKTFRTQLTSYLHSINIIRKGSIHMKQTCQKKSQVHIGHKPVKKYFEIETVKPNIRDFSREVKGGTINMPPLKMVCLPPSPEF